MFAGSWYYDPALENISPHLSYLKEIPLKNGARLFYVGSSKADIEMATKKSKTRKKFYDQGKYVPTRFLLVWPRNGLADWAGKHR